MGLVAATHSALITAASQIIILRITLSQSVDAYCPCFWVILRAQKSPALPEGSIT